MSVITAAIPHPHRALFRCVRINRGVAVTLLAGAIVGCQGTGTESSYPQNLLPVKDRPIVVSKVASQSNVEWANWRSRMAPLFAHARTLVENETGVDLSDVTLNIANDSSITAEVTHETKRLVHSQFDNRNFANQFLDSVMHGQKGTYAALYATRKREVMISQPMMQGYQRSLPSDDRIQESAMLALLIHELVHAADDKRYRIHENRDLNFRASFAQSAAFEGHAQFVTRNICTKADCLSGLEALDEFMFGRRNPPNQLTQSVQAISRNVLEYSYVEGERFIKNLSQRPDGEKLINELLSNPPQDPIQILDPASFPNNAREQRNQQLISASTSINHPWLNSPWTSVETSPLKGVNLRTDPARRNAAVDGFTRLITSMVAMQLYNQSEPGFSPIELTVIKAESNETAKLFGKTLHENTRLKGAQLSRADDLVKVSSGGRNAPPALLYLTRDPGENGMTYYTLIGVSGLHVVQMSGLGKNETLFVDYIDQLLSKLEATQRASLVID